MRQKTKLEEKYVTELKAITEEEMQQLAANYKAQLPGIRDRGWELEMEGSLEEG